MKHYKFNSAAVELVGVGATLEFLEPILSERDRELTLVAFCDVQLRLVELLSFPGDRSRAEVPLSRIFRNALQYAAILMAHNHPSGDPRPSHADVKLTKRVGLACEALDVAFLDHLIFARDGMFSFRQAGLI